MIKAKLGGFLLVGLIFSALFLPLIFSLDPFTTRPRERLLPPLEKGENSGKFYLFGSDANGRDILSRVVYGARVSLFVGLFSRSIALVIGVVLGFIAGFYGGLADRLVTGLIDCTLAFPSLLLAIAISLSLGAGLKTLVISLSVVAWAELARIMRASVMQLRDKEFVLAAKGLGGGNLRIFWHHILPNCFNPMLVAFSAGIATAILAESSLSFLGLGIEPPFPSWGGMIDEGRSRLATHWWLSFFPGLALAAGVFGFNLLGDGLRDLLDPRMKQVR